MLLIMFRHTRYSCFHKLTSTSIKIFMAAAVGKIYKFCRERIAELEPKSKPVEQFYHLVYMY